MLKKILCVSKTNGGFFFFLINKRHFKGRFYRVDTRVSCHRTYDNPSPGLQNQFNILEMHFNEANIPDV